MKRLVCEMCGNSDLVKQEGMYVCQSCGTKYSLEEAKKLIIDGSIEVKGTVSIDNADKLKNLYEIARRAKSNNDAETASKYYEMILIEDPYSWEASFYSTYFKAANCKIGEIQSAAILLENNINTVLGLLKRFTDKPEEQEYYSFEIEINVINLCIMLHSAAFNHYQQFLELEGSRQEYLYRSSAIVDTLYTMGNALENNFPDNKAICEHATSAWKKAIEIHARDYYALADQSYNKAIIESYVAKIKKYEPSYKGPELSTSKGACYIATLVYGTYDCPQVWTLRRFRDSYLSKNLFRKTFIKIYYLLSPLIIKIFGNSNWFIKICRGQLDRLVDVLQNLGFLSTPYNDFNEQNN